MSEARQLAVFIDADNFSSPEVLEHAMQEINALGHRIIAQHAYGAHSSLKGLEATLAKYSIRSIPNLQACKSTTDVALAIGAMETICRNPDIKVVAICSGDADFAPLAVRLRELGCKVICFGAQVTLFANAEAFYDSVNAIQVVESSNPAPAEQAPTPLLAQASSSALPERPRTSAPSSPLLPSVEQALDAWPELCSGQWQPLSQVIAAMRKKGVMGKSTKLANWHGLLTGVFELHGGHKPSKIRYIPKAQQLATAQVLQAWPDLHDGQWHHLSHVILALRAQGFIAEDAKFKKWRYALQHSFELQPEHAPVKIRYRFALGGHKPGAMDSMPTLPVSTKWSPPPILPADKHRLRHVLLQLAAQKIDVSDVLNAVPELAMGHWVSYGVVASRLRAAGLLLPSSSLLWVVRSKPETWQVFWQTAGASQPQAIRYRG